MDIEKAEGVRRAKKKKIFLFSARRRHGGGEFIDVEPIPRS